MAWVKFWEGYWYNDSTGQSSDVEPAELIVARTPEGIKAAAYADPIVFGFGGGAIGLLDQAARDNGIDPASIDWSVYAVPVARAVSRSTGTANGGWELGAADAFIANLILREAALGTVAGRTDPRFAAKAAIFAPDVTGYSGYFNRDGSLYRASEAAGIARDVDLRAQRASEAEFQLSDIVPMIIAAGFTAGLSGVLPGAVAAEAAPVVSAAAVEAAPAVVSADVFGPAVLDASAWSTGSGALLNPAVEAATLGNLANLSAVVPSGYVVNLGNSAQLIAESMLPTVAAPLAQLPTPSMPTPPAAAPAASPAPVVPAVTPSSIVSTAATTGIKALAQTTAAGVLSTLTGNDIQPSQIPPPSNNVLGAWALLGIGGAVALFFILKG